MIDSCKGNMKGNGNVMFIFCKGFFCFVEHRVGFGVDFNRGVDSCFVLADSSIVQSCFLEIESVYSLQQNVEFCLALPCYKLHQLTHPVIQQHLSLLMVYSSICPPYLYTLKS